MIFYFSASGNSRYVANRLGAVLGEQVEYMPAVHAASMHPVGKSIGFVFPVYSWGIPDPVVRFIHGLPRNAFADAVGEKRLPVWAVLTCGDETGMAPEMLRRLLEERGLRLAFVGSVTMPNTYVLLPGFDVDSAEVESRKLSEAPERIATLADTLLQLTYDAGGSRQMALDVVRGSWPRLKSRLIYPLFRHWGVMPGKWHRNDDCISCGLCVRSCPNQNIVMRGGMPVWSINCCSCLACYHACPRHAVTYGRITRRKGQYRFPEEDTSDQ